WRGVVDCLTAGFPCQPFSCAGKRAGVDDPRHLWPHVHRVIEEAQPGIVFLENVPGLLTVRCPDGRTAAQLVFDELAGLGYTIAAGLFSAAEVGAPHLRKRLFILGAMADARRADDERRHIAGSVEAVQGDQQGEASQRKRAWNNARNRKPTMDDAAGPRSNRAG